MLENLNNANQAKDRLKFRKLSTMIPTKPSRGNLSDRNIVRLNNESIDAKLNEINIKNNKRLSYSKRLSFSKLF